jgi:hypothetical protein
MGFANFYKRFIYCFSKISQPLISLLKGIIVGVKTSLFELTPKALDTFKKLKAAFISALVFCYFDLSKTSHLETNTSSFVITGVISQKHNNSSEEYP